MLIETGHSYEVLRCADLTSCTCATELEGTNQPPCGVEVSVLAVMSEFGVQKMADVTFGHPDDLLSAWVDVRFLRSLT